MKIRFKYFGDTSFAKGTGKIVIAYSGNKVGVAFCSPDDKFNKHYGRGLAILRLIESPTYIYEFPQNDGDWMSIIEEKIDYPNWFNALK